MIKFIVLALLIAGCSSSNADRSSDTIVMLSSNDCAKDSAGEWRVTVPFLGKTRNDLEGRVIVKRTMWGNVDYVSYRAVDGSISFQCTEPAGFVVTLLND